MTTRFRIPSAFLLTLWAGMLIGFFLVDDWSNPLKYLWLLISAAAGAPVFGRIDRADDMAERTRGGADK